MSALEKEIMEYVRKMDEAQQREVLEAITIVVKEETHEEWLQRIEDMRLKLTSKYGPDDRRIRWLESIQAEMS